MFNVLIVILIKSKYNIQIHLKKESLLKKIPDSEIHLSIDKNDFLHLDTLLMKNKFKTIANTSHLNNK